MEDVSQAHFLQAWKVSTTTNSQHLRIVADNSGKVLYCLPSSVQGRCVSCKSIHASVIYENISDPEIPHGLLYCYVHRYWNRRRYDIAYNFSMQPN
jgi:hypothetical protein